MTTETKKAKFSLRRGAINKKYLSSDNFDQFWVSIMKDLGVVSIMQFLVVVVIEFLLSKQKVVSPIIEAVDSLVFAGEGGAAGPPGLQSLRAIVVIFWG